MRIDSLDVASYTVPTEAPECDGTLRWTETTVVVVEPVAAGVRGLGFSYATDASATLVRDVLANVVVGRHALDVTGTWTAMVDAIRNLGRAGVASMAIAAVDTALWDLKAKLLGVPLARLLGVVHTQVPIYGSGGFTSYTVHELIDQLVHWSRDDGIPRVKMKVGTSWGRQPEVDLQRVAAVRAAIGDRPELMVDANGAYTAKQAVRLARSFAEQGVSWFEEPVSSDDLQGLRTVRELVDLDVAAGEYGYDLSYFEHMAGSGSVDVLQVDVSRCAGITEWMRAAAVAAAHGLDVAPGDARARPVPVGHGPGTEANRRRPLPASGVTDAGRATGPRPTPRSPARQQRRSATYRPLRQARKASSSCWDRSGDGRSSSA